MTDCSSSLRCHSAGRSATLANARSGSCAAHALIDGVEIREALGGIRHLPGALPGLLRRDRSQRCQQMRRRLAIVFERLPKRAGDIELCVTQQQSLERFATFDRIRECRAAAIIVSELFAVGAFRPSRRWTSRCENSDDGAPSRSLGAARVGRRQIGGALSRRCVNGERMGSTARADAAEGATSTARSRFHSQPPAIPAAMPVMTQTSEERVTIGGTSGNESAL